MPVFPTTTITPTTVWPDFDGAQSFGPPQEQQSNQPYLWFAMFDNNYSIASVANTTPIELTFTTKQGRTPGGTWEDGQEIFVVGCSVFNANGRHVITKTANPNVIKLAGTTASGTGSGGVGIDPKLGLFSKFVDGLAWLGRALSVGTNVFGGYWFANGQITDSNPTIPTSGGAGVPLDLIVPNGAMLVGLSVKLYPAVHANLPASMPKLSLFQRDLDGSVIDSWVETDPSPDVATYNAAHNLVLTISPNPILIDYTQYTYVVSFDGESGADSQALPIGPLARLFTGLTG